MSNVVGFSEDQQARLMAASSNLHGDLFNKLPDKEREAHIFRVNQVTYALQAESPHLFTTKQLVYCKDQQKKEQIRRAK